MAEVFSFTCPQCGKTYGNVKANMAGRKVSCTCGKVFRLGPKTEEQIAARAKRKAEKLAAKKLAAQNPPTSPTDSVPQKSAPARPIQRPAQAGPFEAEIPGLEDDPVDAKPMTPQTPSPPVNPGAFETDSLLEISTAGTKSKPSDNNSPSSSGPLPLGWALATPEPNRKTVPPTSKATFKRKPGLFARVLAWFSSRISRRK